MPARRRVLGVHLCWGTYGFWLPNDPRGSGSRKVWADHLKPFGEATFVEDRKRSRARTSHDWRLRLAAKQELTRTAVKFDGLQARCAGYAFAACLDRLRIDCWACAVLPDHVHMVVGPSHVHGDELIAELKRWATKALLAEGRHPFGDQLAPAGTPSLPGRPGRLSDGQPPMCWQVNGWPAWEFTPADVRRAIKYVEDNPLKEGKPRQNWKFVVPYRG